MNTEEMLAFATAVEEKYPVDKWQIGSIHIWPYVRVKLDFSCRDNLAVVAAEKNKNKACRWREYGARVGKVLADKSRLLMKDKLHQQSIVPADVVFLGDTGDRNVCMPDGTLLDHNLDPIRMKLEERGLTAFSFEELGKDNARLPRWCKTYTIDKIVLQAQIHNKLSRRHYTAAECNLAGYDEFLDDLEKRGLDKEKFSAKKISKTAMFINDLAQRFYRILKEIKPKIVILQCWYSPSKMALSLAAHKLDIPVLEIQHGVAAGSKNHPSYYQWIKMPSNGFELMPDYMWVWDKYDYAEMEPWAKNSMRPFIGGHPMNLLWSDQQSELSKYYNALYDREFGRDKKAILVTLQWGNSYPQWFIDFINGHDEFNWLIRLHPVVDEYELCFIRKLAPKDNIKIDKVSKFPLEILLENISLHVTMSSSVVLDAEPYGKHSIVMNGDGKNKYSRQIDSGIVCYGENQEDFTQYIKELMTNELNETNINIHNSYEEGKKAIEMILDIIDRAKPYWE
ncbi:MAG: hypothetical protein J6H31_14440 [Butyrivibrio sp.]|nr:hypothetical protein [Butyrivibrio sp.]